MFLPVQGEKRSFLTAPFNILGLPILLAGFHPGFCRITPICDSGIKPGSIGKELGFYANIQGPQHKANPLGVKFWPSSRHEAIFFLLSFTPSIKSGFGYLSCSPGSPEFFQDLNSRTWIWTRKTPAVRLGSCNKQHIFSFLPWFPLFCLLLGLSRQPCSCPLASNTLEMRPAGCLPGLLGVSSTPATQSLLVQVGLPLVSWVPLGLDSISPGLPHCMAVQFFILNRGRCLLAWKLMWYWNFSPVYIFLCVGKLGITSSFSESFPVSFRRNKRKLQLSCASESSH